MPQAQALPLPGFILKSDAEVDKANAVELAVTQERVRGLQTANSQLVAIMMAQAQQPPAEVHVHVPTNVAGRSRAGVKALKGVEAKVLNKKMQQVAQSSHSTPFSCAFA